MDANHRANPANGLYLCAFCHTAYDSREIAIQLDGELLVSATLLHDPIANAHFSARTAAQRSYDLSQDSREFLDERIHAWQVLHRTGNKKSQR